MIQNDEFIQDFVQEAKAHVESVESGLLELNEDFRNPETVNNIFRAVHSIKGTAGFFNLQKIIILSHAMENIFGEVRSGSLNITADRIDTLLQANDMLRVMVDDVYKSEEADTAVMEAELAAILTGTKKPGEKSGNTVEKESTEPASDAGAASPGGEKNAVDPDEGIKERGTVLHFTYVAYLKKAGQLM